MTNRLALAAAAALFAMSMVPIANNASAMPVAGALTIKNAVPTNVETVRWRGRGWRGRGGAGVAAGIIGGAILGGMLAAPYYAYDGPYYGPYYGSYYGPGYGGNAVGYCMQRFRSYDPGSGTYLGYDGYLHPCP